MSVQQTIRRAVRGNRNALGALARRLRTEPQRANELLAPLEQYVKTAPYGQSQQYVATLVQVCSDAIVAAKAQTLVPRIAAFLCREGISGHDGTPTRIHILKCVSLLPHVDALECVQQRRRHATDMEEALWAIEALRAIVPLVFQQRRFYQCGRWMLRVKIQPEYWDTAVCALADEKEPVWLDAHSVFVAVTAVAMLLAGRIPFTVLPKA